MVRYDGVVVMEIVGLMSMIMETRDLGFMYTACRTMERLKALF